MRVVLKRRVCHISTVHPLSDVRVFYRECCSLVQAGYEVHLVIPTSEAVVTEGVHVHPLPAPRSRLIRMLVMPWVAMIAALKTKATLYHYHDPELLFMGFVLRWLFRKEVVFDIHESVPRQIASKPYLPRFARVIAPPLYRLLERIFTAGQTLIVANKNSMSDYSAEACLVQNYPLLCQDILADEGRPNQKAKPPLLVYVGGVADIRGGMTYVELAGKLAKHRCDFNMHVIGPCRQQYAEELTRRIGELGLQQRVKLSPRMAWREAMQIVSTAQIGMCLLMPVPNYTTCLATKILEYMMLGTPVLASDFDCWREFVEGEKVGKMADPENIDRIAAVCREMLDDPDELSSMAARGIAAVRSRYNWDSEFQNMLKCYDRLFGDTN